MFVHTRRVLAPAAAAAEHRVEGGDAVDVRRTAGRACGRPAGERRRRAGRAPSARGAGRRGPPVACSDTARTAPRSSTARRRRILLTSGCCLGRKASGRENTERGGASIVRAAWIPQRSPPFRPTSPRGNPSHRDRRVRR